MAKVCRSSPKARIWYPVLGGVEITLQCHSPLNETADEMFIVESPPPCLVESWRIGQGYGVDIRHAHVETTSGAAD